MGTALCVYFYGSHEYEQTKAKTPHFQTSILSFLKIRKSLSRSKKRAEAQSENVKGAGGGGEGRSLQEHTW